jgi:prepilin-type processing-associated H-X9-DG protein
MVIIAIAHTKKGGGFFSRLIIAILAAILFPVFAKAREKARQTSCLNNQKQIATSAMLYVQDHDELLPAAELFWGSLSLDKGVLQCPTAGTKIANGYGYNTHIAGMALGEVTDTSGTVMIADSDTATNQISARLDVSKRHNKASICTFVDGHVEITSTVPAIIIPKIDPITVSFADSCIGTDPDNNTPITNGVFTYTLNSPGAGNTVKVDVVAGASNKLSLSYNGDGPTERVKLNLGSFYTGTIREWVFEADIKFAPSTISYGEITLYNSAGAKLLYIKEQSQADIISPSGTTRVTGAEAAPFFNSYQHLRATCSASSTLVEFGGVTWTYASGTANMTPRDIDFFINWNHSNAMYIKNLRLGFAN